MTCEACNTIPPVIAEGYETKGSWTEVAGLKTYTTGPQTSTRALITIYDIFGIAPQTLQGADALATALNCLVIIPDFFKGGKAEGEWFSNPSDENNAKKDEFLKYALDFKNFVPVVSKVVQEGSVKWSSVKSWGTYGLCWGGKVVALSSGPGTPFAASGQVHPGRLEIEDAKKIGIPHIVLASNGEDKKIVDEYAEVLVGDGKSGEVEYYGNMHHGWMGARANLGDAENLKEYERGYNQLAKFFGKNL